MRNRTWSVVVLGVALSCAPKLVSGGEPDHLVITELPAAFQLTVPVSSLVMEIPKGGLTQPSVSREGSRANPRYFYFADEVTGVLLSGWFESDAGFSGVQKFWADELAAWPKMKLPTPEDVTFRKIGGWDTVVYRVPVPTGTNPNIRAHWVQAGTWIDLHLSVLSTSPAADALAQLETLLKSIRVSVKPL